MPGILCLCTVATLHAQHPATPTDTQLDSTYIEAAESPPESPAKVLHAEPLYIDLIRDLGARKGEQEWNFALDVADNLLFDSYLGIIEYEWAPVHRLGLELETQVLFFSPNRLDTETDTTETPGSRIKSIKAAAQYTFCVAPRARFSAALGYLHEWELVELRELTERPAVFGQILSPFLVVAKRWGSNWHSLVYTGPLWEHVLNGPQRGKTQLRYQFNPSVHYLITGTRNFVGLETNYLWEGRETSVVFRPQMRLAVADNLLIGISVGIPLNKTEQRLSSFARLIWEPSHLNRLSHRADAHRR
ncbi:MAG: HAEPLYID family protein [Bacteroidia bacterium]|nr:HAEPLYID family protein [Bacteroidia bacterium]